MFLDLLHPASHIPIMYPWKRTFSSVVLSDVPFNKLNGPQRSLTFPFPVSNLPLPQIQFWHPTYLAKISLSKRQPLPNQAPQLPHSSIPYLLSGEEVYRANSQLHKSLITEMFTESAWHFSRSFKYSRKYEITHPVQSWVNRSSTRTAIWLQIP